MIICIIILIIAIILTISSFNKNNKSKPIIKLIGSWTNDNVTVYRFDEDNAGELIVPLNKYAFTYKITDKKLSIDFENEKSEDSEYEYSFEKDKLILKGNYGTYTFEKKN